MNPPEDYFVVHCKGHCGKSYHLTMTELRRSLKHMAYTSFRQYADSYVCQDCCNQFSTLVQGKDTISA